MGRPTHASIEKTRNELAKIEASIKTTHTAFPKGTKFRYAAAIITARDYRKRVTAVGSAWTFTNPTNPSTYDPRIKTLTAELTKAHKKPLWELRRDEHEVYLGIEDVWK